MAVFSYKVTIKEREDAIEEGTVVASDEADARQKLQRYDYKNVRLRKLSGVSAFLNKFFADVK